MTVAFREKCLKLGLSEVVTDFITVKQTKYVNEHRSIEVAMMGRFDPSKRVYEDDGSFHEMGYNNIYDDQCDINIMMTMKPLKAESPYKSMIVTNKEFINMEDDAINNLHTHLIEMTAELDALHDQKKRVSQRLNSNNMKQVFIKNKASFT